MDNATLKYVLDQLYKEYLIPLFLVNDQYEIVIPKTNWSSRNFKEQVLEETHPNEIRYFKKGAFFYSNFAFELPEYGTGTVMIGPCGALEAGSDSIHFQGHTYFAGIHYSKSSREGFERFTNLIFAIIRGTLGQNQKQHWYYDRVYKSTNYHLAQNLSSRRDQKNTLDSYEFERRYIEAIRRNEPDKIKWLFKKMADTYKVKLSASDLEGLKYKYAGLITILTRVSIEDGVPAEQAFSLSDALLQRLQSIYTYAECLVSVQEASYKFMDMIHSYQYATKNQLVQKMLNYIDEHIYDRITLADLADFTNRHKTSISTQFKKEVGQPIHVYINHKKIQESKHLLLFTELSLKEISGLLHYSSQSHFVHTFKQFMGITPGEFRNENLTYHFE